MGCATSSKEIKTEPVNELNPVKYVGKVLEFKEVFEESEFHPGGSSHTKVKILSQQKCHVREVGESAEAESNYIRECPVPSNVCFKQNDLYIAGPAVMRA